MARTAVETSGRRAAADATAEFERLYRANVDAVTAYFARRTTDPHVVADLTADTFVAVTTHPNGTVTLAVYQTSGIAGANSKLHELGDRVVVVPVQAGCPSIGSLPAPAVRAAEISVQVSGSSDGSVTVDAHGIPAGDILVLGVSAVDGQFQFFPRQSTSQDHSTEASPPTEVNPSTKAGHSSRTSNSAEASHAAGSRGGSGPGEWMPGPNGSVSKLTSGPAPSCVSVPPGPATNRP